MITNVDENKIKKSRQLDEKKQTIISPDRIFQELVKYSRRLGDDCTDLQKALELFLGVPNRATNNLFIDSIEGYRGNIYKLGRYLCYHHLHFIDLLPPPYRVLVAFQKGHAQGSLRNKTALTTLWTELPHIVSLHCFRINKASGIYIYNNTRRSSNSDITSIGSTFNFIFSIFLSFSF